MRLGRLAYVVLLLALGGAAPAWAQGGPQVQEFTGTVNDAAEIVFYDLYGLQAGQTLYAYVEATSGNLDTYLYLGDIDFVEIFAEDDDGGGGLNSALSYPIPHSGDYTLAVTRYNEASAGDYRLLVGINAPQVLSGQAQPTGHEIAVLYGSSTSQVTDCSVLSARPTLSGPEKLRDTAYFVLHYTQSGPDQASDHYVEEVLAILDSIWEREIEEFGWPAPPNDCGEGGDTRYDVYLMETLDVDGTLGYVHPENLIGDNPASPAVEEWAVYSYMVIDNDLAGLDKPFALLRATVAHELHHSIQFGYDLNDIGGEWYYEATASWMETQAFPEYEDATPYAIDLFHTPDLCIGSTPDDPAYSLRIYGEWLLLDSLARDYGVGVVQRLWQLIADYEGLESFYRLLDELNTTPQQVMTTFAIRNLLLDYALADRFEARVRLEASIDGLGRVTPRQDGVQQLGVDYLRVAAPGLYTFSIDRPNLSLIVVGVDQAAGLAYSYHLGGGGTVDTTPFDHAYVLVFNTEAHHDSDTCATTDWVLTVTDGAASAATQPEPKLWDASRFIPAG